MKTLRESGSFRLIEHDGRHAIVEVRDGQIYAMTGTGERPSAPDTHDGMQRVVDACDGWNDEETARQRFDELVERGNDLAARAW